MKDSGKAKSVSILARDYGYDDINDLNEILGCSPYDVDVYYDYIID
jgi:hypothetical protein